MLSRMTRRELLKLAIGSAGIASLGPIAWASDEEGILHRKIPSSGETIPVVGLGTAQVFDVSASIYERNPLAEVLRALVDNGAMLIDSSPMYGNAETVVGDLLHQEELGDRIFYATKVWTDKGKHAGENQMNQSMNRMRTKVMDLMQVHNLVDTDTHMETLREWKAQGKIRYIGATTSRTSMFGAMADVIKKHKPDFVQFNYSMIQREAEKELLPLCLDQGIATLINLPYRRAAVFKRVKGLDVPEWAREFDCTSWGQFFLKFLISHPGVSCVIPGTSKAEHMVDNAGAGFGRLPDATIKQRMIEFFDRLPG